MGGSKDRRLDIGKGGTKSALAQGAQQAFRQQRQLFRTARPIQKEFGAQTLEALRTGGVGAQIPIIQRAVEQTRQAGAQGLRATEESLAQRNLGGTPFGERILAQTRQQGRLAAAQIPTQFAQQFITGAPGFASQLSGQAAQLGLGAQQQAGQLAQGKQQKGGQMAKGAGQGLFSLLGPCDLALKEHVVRVGTSPSGFGIFEFNYRNGCGRYRGPVAQDVEVIRPEAVVHFNGVRYVRIDMIDVPLEAI